MAPLALVPVFPTRWGYLHKLQVWSPSSATYILTLPWIALLALSVGIELITSSARATSVKFAKHPVSLLETVRPIYRTPGIPGFSKKLSHMHNRHIPRYPELSLQLVFISAVVVGQYSRFVVDGESGVRCIQCISSRFDHHVAHLNWLQTWPPDAPWIALLALN